MLAGAAVAGRGVTSREGPGGRGNGVNERRWGGGEEGEEGMLERARGISA